jgi:hypothetical protein
MQPFVPKVRLWKKDGTYTEHVFPSSSSNASERAGVKVHKNHPIFVDDNIHTVRKKIAIALGVKNPNELYMWHQRHIENDVSVVLNFIENCFRNERRVSMQRLSEQVKYFFGVEIRSTELNMVDKRQAVELIMSKKPKVCIESSAFKYTYNNFLEYIPSDPFKAANYAPTDTLDIVNLSTYTLETLDIHEDIINVVHIDTLDKSMDKSVKGVYFPFSESKGLTKDDEDFIATMNTLQLSLQDVEIDKKEIAATSIINYVHIKGNDVGAGKKHVLNGCFDSFSTSDEIPFIKFKTSTNIFHKIHKKCLVKIKPEEFDKWTVAGSANKDEKTFLIFKILFRDNIYGSLIINNDLVYHLKLNFSNKDGIGEDHVNAFLPKVNSILQHISKYFDGVYIPTLDQDMLKASRDSHITKVSQIITSSTCSSKSKKINFEKFHDIIKAKFSPYFNIINNPDKSILHLQYKKIDNYIKYDTIQSFIASHASLEVEDLVNQIMITFLVSKDEALKQVDQWQHSDDQTKEKTRHAMGNRFMDNYVNIKVRLNTPVEMKYLANGMKNLRVHQRISDLMKVLVKLSFSASKIKKDEISKIERLDMIDMPLPVAEEDKDDIDVALEQDVASDMGSDLFDDELLALEQEFATVQEVKKPQAVSQVKTIEDKPVEKKGKVKGYILSKLHEADRGLFEYVVPKEQKRKDYSSLCGWVDRRQPVAISDDELARIAKDYPKALNGSVKTGSTHDHEQKNNYVCPKIWCPKSRVALSYEDYVKYGNKCPFPEIEEEPIMFASKSYWGEDEKGLTRGHYPGFLDKFTRPDGLCLPCCFKKEPKEGNRNKARQNLCYKGSDKENLDVADTETDVMGNEKYIKGEHYVPLESNRYGLVPQALSSYFGDKTRGMRHDGTGMMTQDTSCFLRRGIPQSPQSFLDCISTVLDNGDIKTTDDLVKTIVNNLTVQDFITLESGRIMKLFVNDATNIHDKTTFKEFTTWLVKQEDYIRKMSLTVIKNNIVAMKGKFDPSNAFAADVIREFLIYTAFTAFQQYMTNNAIFKSHHILLDLVNTMQWLNIHRHNIVVLEYDPQANKLHIDCQFNKNLKDVVDIRKPFVFVLKRTNYYEPIYHVSMSGTTLVSNNKVMYHKSNDRIKRFITYIISNCSSKEKHGNNNVEVFLESLGYPIKYHVIDYGYKTCGYILEGNLYIPLQSREEVSISARTRFVYISDVYKFKCKLSRDKIKQVFKTLQSYTKSDFYSVDLYIVNKAKELEAVVLKDDVFVPINTKPSKFTQTYFENGLHIFVGEQKDDIRVHVNKMLSDKMDNFNKSLSSIKSKMPPNEMNFLMDPNNPLPKRFKRERLFNIVMSLLKKEKSDESKLLQAVTAKSLVDYLIREREHVTVTNKFKPSPYEVLLDHFDIMHGKLKEAIEFEKDPYKAILKKLNNVAEEYVFPDPQENVFAHIVTPETSVIEVPVKWRKILIGYQCTDFGDTYNAQSLFMTFSLISRAFNRKSFTEDIYKGVFRRKLVRDYQEDALSELYKNPSVETYMKKKNVTHPSLDFLLEMTASPYYHPNYYDIRLLAKLSDVNLIIIGRKTTENPDGLEIVNMGSTYYMVLVYKYDRFRKIDTFDFIFHDKTLLFDSQHLGKDVMKIVKLKSSLYEVNVDDDSA